MNISIPCKDTDAKDRLASVYQEWLECMTKTECGTDGLSDDAMQELIDQRWDLYAQAANLSATKVPGYVVAWKVRMLEYEMKSGQPSDNRLWLMLASIRADLET